MLALLFFGLWVFCGSSSFFLKGTVGYSNFWIGQSGKKKLSRRAERSGCASRLALRPLSGPEERLSGPLFVAECTKLCSCAQALCPRVLGLPCQSYWKRKETTLFQCWNLCQSLVPCLHLGGSDFKSAEPQQNRNDIKRNLNSQNIAKFFCRIIKKTCRKNHAAWFHAEPCRDEKRVQ